MEKVLNIALDLGGDTIKIAFAFDDDFLKTTYGKFSCKSKLTQIAIPAIGYYSEDEDKWYYGDQIAKQSDSFVTVVKIKSLISLLTKQESSIWQRNKNYYYNEHYFPKFYFPVRKRMLDDFGKMVASDMTFTCERYTPQEICKDFFNYIKDLVDKRCAELNMARGTEFSSYRISVIHPSSVGDEYLHELSYLVQKSFGVKPFKIINSTKALSIYAFHRGAVRNNESFLVFDMGEEEISVTRTGFINNQIFVDGVEGHNEPLQLGGIDVDQAIVENIYKSIADRETIGSPSAGKKGHIFERGVFGKQYLLMKDVKKAKVILGKPLKEDSFFSNGVPVTLGWELFIQKRFTREDFKNSMGYPTNSGVAEKICDYIIKEVTRPINHDVKKIFLSGGIAETYCLVEYICEQLKYRAPDVKVCTFDNCVYEGDDFTILSHEDSVFAAAIGGAIVALKNIEIKTILSLSYATWAIIDNIKCLSIFAERGEIIDGGRRFVNKYHVGQYGVLEGEELFSTYLSKADIAKNVGKGKWNYTDSGGLIIGEDNTVERSRAHRDFDLRVVSGGKDGKIIFRHNGKQCRIITDYKIGFEEGIMVDSKGVATPILRNITPKGVLVRILYLNVSGYSSENVVDASSIEIVPVGLKGFVTVQD
ncbi:MAG: hypothetical protein IKV61_03945 [Clostridia bacterium]|nr:hypothetical protein [Clostridia bacterium]